MKNLEIIEIREKENLLLLKGSVPGARNSIVTLYQQKTA
jgi:ribosomal protein L3